MKFCFERKIDLFFLCIRQTSEKWSRFLDEYPDRFKINYPLPDDDNDLYFPNRPGRYPVRFSFFFCFFIIK